MPTHLKLDAPWAGVKEMLKESNHLLTDDDLVYVPGQDTALLEQLSKKLGMDVGKVKGWIESVSFNRGRAS